MVAVDCMLLYLVSCHAFSFCHASDVGIFFPLISFFGLYMSTLPIYLITYVQKKWEYLFFVEC